MASLNIEGGKLGGRNAKFGYFDQQIIEMLRSVFDDVVVENSIPVDSREYADLAQTVIDLYLSGTVSSDDLKRMATIARAA